jgi:putative endonuclease
MKDSTTNIGQHAEKEAWQFLATQGFELLEKNFSCRAGEIDLIVRDTETLVFVEVRFRQNSSYGSGAETVTSAKRRRIIRTAEYYLLGNPDTSNLDFRFDVISIGSSVDWIENAFTLNDR